MVSSLSPKMVGRTIKEYVLITFGLFCYAFAWVGIILPAKIVGGGVGGMALLIYHATGGDAGGIPLAYSMLAINGGLLIVATFLIGSKFTTKTVYAVIMMSVLMGFLQGVVPPDLLGLGEKDKFLSAILAGAIGGIGISICFSQGGSTGGTDIIAMIINKFRPVSYGKVIMTCDFIIIGLSYFIGNDITTVIYSFVVVGAMGYTLDAVMAGNKQSSQIFIISPQYEKIAEHIIKDAQRGVTMLPAEGWYTKTPMKMLVVVCRKSETNTLLRVVRDIDPEAFLTVGSVMGVYGKGFEQLRVSGRGKKKKIAA